MTKDEAIQAASGHNNGFDPNRGCPFKSACVNTCPAFIKASATEAKNKDGKTFWAVNEPGCKIIAALDRILE